MIEVTSDNEYLNKNQNGIASQVQTELNSVVGGHKVSESFGSLLKPDAIQITSE